MIILATLVLIASLGTAAAALGPAPSQMGQGGRFSSISLERGHLFVTGFGGIAAWGKTLGLSLHQFSTSIILCQAQQGSFLTFAQALGHITFSKDAGQTWKQIAVPGYFERTHQIQIREDGLWLVSDRGSVWHLDRRGEVVGSFAPPARALGIRDVLWHRQRCWLLTFDGDLWSLDAGQWQQHTIQGNQSPVVFLPGAEREEPGVVAESGAIYRGGRWWWSPDFRDLPSRARFVRSGPLVYALYRRVERGGGERRALHLIRILTPRANRVDLSETIQLPVTPASIALEKQGSHYRIAVINAFQPSDIRVSSGGSEWQRLGFALLNPQVDYAAAAGVEPGNAAREGGKQLAPKPPL